MTLRPVCRNCHRAAVWAFVILLAVTTSEAATVVGTTTVSSVAHAFATHPSFSEAADYLALFSVPAGPSLSARADLASLMKASSV